MQSNIVPGSRAAAMLPRYGSTVKPTYGTATPKYGAPEIGAGASPRYSDQQPSIFVEEEKLPPSEEHPLKMAYDRLSRLVPQMPRTNDGFADQTYVRAALSVEGVDDNALSVKGFAELLALCDTSPAGFPSFGDFVLCLSRPHRMGGGRNDRPSPLHGLPNTDTKRREAIQRAEATYHEALARVYGRGARRHTKFTQWCQTQISPLI